MPESGENRSMLGQTLASDLRIKIYLEVSSGPNEIAEAIDEIMMTVNRPRRGLTDDLIQIAHEMDSRSDLISYLQKRPATAMSILGI